MEPFVDQGRELWAHPVAVLAIPAFIPVVVVIVTVLWVARKDRLAEKHERQEAERADAGDALVEESAAVATDTGPGASSPTRRRWRDRIPAVVITDEQGDDRELRRRHPEPPETRDG